MRPTRKEFLVLLAPPEPVPIPRASGKDKLAPFEPVDN